MIWYLLGKSATGKDHIYRELVKDGDLCLNPVVLYTTRPMRRGEEDGVAYHFVTPERMAELQAEGKVIESRTYGTVHGPWTYATVDDGSWDEGRDYLVEGVLESYCSLKVYFGEERVLPLYIEVDDGDRLERALKRERKQPAPCYSELCRRFLADQEDFSPEKLRGAGITRVYRNDDLASCIGEIRGTILAVRQGK